MPSGTRRSAACSSSSSSWRADRGSRDTTITSRAPSEPPRGPASTRGGERSRLPPRLALLGERDGALDPVARGVDALAVALVEEPRLAVGNAERGVEEALRELDRARR